jgi:hypothetical protein
MTLFAKLITALLRHNVSDGPSVTLIRCKGMTNLCHGSVMMMILHHSVASVSKKSPSQQACSPPNTREPPALAVCYCLHMKQFKHYRKLVVAVGSQVARVTNHFSTILDNMAGTTGSKTAPLQQPGLP